MFHLILWFLGMGIVLVIIDKLTGGKIGRMDSRELYGCIFLAMSAIVFGPDLVHAEGFSRWVLWGIGAFVALIAAACAYFFYILYMSDRDVKRAAKERKEGGR